MGASVCLLVKVSDWRSRPEPEDAGRGKLTNKICREHRRLRSRMDKDKPGRTPQRSQVRAHGYFMLARGEEYADQGAVSSLKCNSSDVIEFEG